MATYWISCGSGAGMTDGKVYRSLERAKDDAIKLARGTSGEDIKVYRTAYQDVAKERGAHFCASYDYLEATVHAPAI